MKLRKLKQYLEDFQEEEYEILVFITKGWSGASRLDGYREVTSYSAAMIDIRTGEFRAVDGRIENVIPDKEYEQNQYCRFEDNKIYRIRVRKCKWKDLGPEYMASMNERYLLKEVIREEDDPKLSAFRAEYLKPVIIKVAGTDFVLDRNLGWYEGTVEILGEPCTVYLELDADSKTEASGAAEKFAEILPRITELHEKCLEQSAEAMLDSANEWKENEDDPDITAEVFKENVGAPHELVMHDDGSAEFMYGDGDMFGGHGIQVGVDADGEIDDCELVG
ncbi:MAG: DUF2262 domain-containing protein [Clostridiales bacterium]|nr:DUF2262 domain-containing protein [Clostridiales bacterium]